MRELLLPEIWTNIFEYDNTYHQVYKVVLAELVLMSKLDRFFSAVVVELLIFTDIREEACKLIRKPLLQQICRNKRLAFRKRDTKIELLTKITRFYFACTWWRGLSCVR
jgi:hypothetical protein